VAAGTSILSTDEADGAARQHRARRAGGRGGHPYRSVDAERLILTPHNVGHSEAGRRANLALALEQILAVGRGEPPAHVINPEAIPAWRMRR